MQLTCPTCGGHAVQRQSLGKKAGKAVVFGVFAAMSIAKTFKCGSCGYTR